MAGTRSRNRLESLPKVDRQKTINRVTKIVISKSVEKRRQSTRRIAARLSNRGVTISKFTVHRYLKGNLGLKSCKIPKTASINRKNEGKSTKVRKKNRKLDNRGMGKDALERRIPL